MKVAPGMHVEWVDDEAVILDPETHQLHYLNPQAALVYALIGEHGLTAAIDDLRSRHAGEDSLDEQLVGLVWQLHDRGLLVDD